MTLHFVDSLPATRQPAFWSRSVAAPACQFALVASRCYPRSPPIHTRQAPKSLAAQMEIIAFSTSSTSHSRTILLSSALDFGRDDNEPAASVRAHIVRSAIFLVYEADALGDASFLDSGDNTYRFLSPSLCLPRPTPSETTSPSSPTDQISFTNLVAFLHLHNLALPRRAFLVLHAPFLLPF